MPAKVSAFFISHTDVLFIYCPIVTAVSARYCCRYAQASAAAIYFHATKPETVVIIRSEQAIAEIIPIANNKKLRPFGLCAGEFTVPDDFDASLTEDMLDAFEGK